MKHDPPVSGEQHGFAAAALCRLRGRGMKVMVQEVTAFGLAFALSLVISVGVVELIWALI
jgi:hypothetical protein